MTAAETIQAAIDRLTELRSGAAYVGPWRRNKSWAIDGDGDYITGSVDYETADLIVTLHRTIDAQLAILRNALHRIKHSSVSVGAELDLAKAILGGTE